MRDHMRDDPHAAADDLRPGGGPSIARWRAINAVFDAVVDLPAAERPGALRRHCGDDQDLAREVESLLAACDVAGPSRDLGRGPGTFAPPRAPPGADGAAPHRGLPDLRSRVLSGTFRVEREIGRGGMATVYLARRVADGEPVALKVLLPALAQLLGTERFLREVTITSSIPHPNIIEVLAADSDAGVLYYAMPYVAGGTLKDRLAREGQLPLEDVVRITRDVAAALDEAHGRGVVHRDVKPQNILLDDERALVADFGIARFVDAAGHRQLTESGLRVGTPAYMSPEQCDDSTRLDQRADVYALGCVVYEMLAGEPPYAGPTPHAVAAKHMFAPIPDVRVLRDGLSERVRDVLCTALAKQPADRYRSTGALARAVQRALLEPAPWLTWRRAAAGAVAAAAAVLAGTAISNDRRAERLAVAAADTTRLVLLPLEHDAPDGARRLDDELLHEAMARWRGVTVVDRFQVTEALRRTSPRSTHDASRLARSLGAARYVRGRVTARGGGHSAYAALYDATSGTALFDAREDVPSDFAGAKAAYARLADRLLLRGASAGAEGPRPADGRSLPAVQAVARAQMALGVWDLAAADAAFEAAVGYDPDDAAANLWLAQVRAWRGQAAGGWGVIARRALARDAALTDRERSLARALDALAAGRYAEACRLYDALRRANARDFAAWYGLGQCRRMDRVVLRDPASPSGWRFRSSYDSALVAYSTAFEILPSTLRAFEPEGFQRLRDLLLLSPTLVIGRSQEPDSARLYGRPGWIGGRLTLVPYPWEVVSAGGPEAVPPGFAEAMRQQRIRFRRIAENWSAAFPRSAGAKHAVALSLELLGDSAAIDTVRLARGLTRDSARQTELAASEALLLLKFGAPDRLDRLARAAALADSLLERTAAGPSRGGHRLAMLGAMRRRCARTAALARLAPTADVEALQLAPGLYADVQEALAHASLGCATDGARVRRLVSSVERELAAIPAGDRQRNLELQFFRVVLLAPTLDSVLADRLGAASANPLLRAARAYARHDSAEVRRELGAFAASWQTALGPATADVVFPGARLLAGVGDTPGAVRWLDRTLLSVNEYDPDVLRDMSTLASFVRSMQLRAALARAVGDEAEARRWSDAVRAVWPDARSTTVAASARSGPAPSPRR